MRLSLRLQLFELAHALDAPQLMLAVATVLAMGFPFIALLAADSHGADSYARLPWSVVAMVIGSALAFCWGGLCGTSHAARSAQRAVAEVEPGRDVPTVAGRALTDAGLDIGVVLNRFGFAAACFLLLGLWLGINPDVSYGPRPPPWLSGLCILVPGAAGLSMLGSLKDRLRKAAEGLPSSADGVSRPRTQDSTDGRVGPVGNSDHDARKGLLAWLDEHPEADGPLMRAYLERQKQGESGAPQ